jgi:hypothetical protein
LLHSHRCLAAPVKWFKTPSEPISSFPATHLFPSPFLQAFYLFRDHRVIIYPSTYLEPCPYNLTPRADVAALCGNTNGTRVRIELVAARMGAWRSTVGCSNPLCFRNFALKMCYIDIERAESRINRDQQRQHQSKRAKELTNAHLVSTAQGNNHARTKDQSLVSRSMAKQQSRNQGRTKD